MQFDVTSVFNQNFNAWDENWRVFVNQGGTRSSKTYSLCQLFVVKLLQYTGKVLTIVRKTMPTLKASVMRDFFEILHNMDLYDSRYHNKTESTYHLNGNLVEFVALDDAQKARGRKRNWLWMNEGNELRLEDWRQLSFRTSEKIFLDFNPSDEFHWIYDSVMTRDDCKFIKSTYLDNSFLSPELINEIERLKEEDETYWKVYGLGERGSSGATIYTNWELCEKIPENINDWCFGLDFGYNVPSSFVFCGFKENRCFIRQLIHEKGLTNSDLISRLNELDIEYPELQIKNKEIFADAAEPKSIEELYRAGFNSHKSIKDVAHGLKTVKSFELLITKDSDEIQKEIKYYKFKEDKDSNVLDQPCKFNDHAMDAIRYGIHTYMHGKKEINAIDLDWA